MDDQTKGKTSTRMTTANEPPVVASNFPTAETTNIYVMFPRGKKINFHDLFFLKKGKFVSIS